MTAMVCLTLEMIMFLYPDDNVKTSMRSIVIDPASYDWEGETPIRRPTRDTVIYEPHLGGFTKSPTSGVTPIREPFPP
jgi:pullulanase/glycogen debranching enzyme